MGTGGFMRVLIADDSELLVRRLVRELTAVSGIEIVGQAGTVAEAARAVRVLSPDVMILDIAMPGGSGIDVLEGMKGDRQAPVVVVLTNYGYTQYRKKCFELGARFFLDKSTEFERIGGVLQSLMGRGHSLECADTSSPDGQETTAMESPLHTQLDSPTSSRQEKTTMPERPQLIVDSPGNHQSVNYRCSQCSHEFPLPEGQPPRVAAAELIRGFRRHVQQDHPEVALSSLRVPKG